jgi:hypothetical protein
VRSSPVTARTVSAPTSNSTCRPRMSRSALT